MEDFAVEQVPLRDAVYARLQRMLIERVYRPGQHLVESEIAQRLGVSRGPVREAIQRLERDGWVDVRPRQGAFVHSPSPSEASWFFEVRSLLEREAARFAALRGAQDAPDLLRGIVDQADRLRKADGPTAELADLTFRFHRAVTHLSGNPILEALVGDLGNRSRWYFRPLVERIAERAWEEHRQLAEAIYSGDAELAADLMERHIMWSKAVYLEFGQVEATEES